MAKCAGLDPKAWEILSKSRRCIPALQSLTGRGQGYPPLEMREAKWLGGESAAVAWVERGFIGHELS